MRDEGPTNVRGTIEGQASLGGYEVTYDRRRGARRVSGPDAPIFTSDERRKGDRRRQKAGYFALLGVIFGTTEGREADALSLAGSIRAGLTPKTWSNLRGIGYTAPELAAVIGVSEKTLSRKLNSREPLDIVQGDRTIRLAQVTVDAARASGDVDKALRWLRKPNRILAGEKPLELIATEPGVKLVRRLLGMIEYGGVA